MTTAIFKFALLLALPVLLPGAGNPLTRQAGPFSAQNEPKLQALLRFGRENHLCFGIDFVDDSMNKRTTIHLPRTTVRNAVEAILVPGEASSLTLTALKGVILVRSNRSPSPEWLSQRLPRFRIGRMQVVWASLNLSMALERYLNPSIQGFAGDFPPGDPADQVGPFDIRNATIRELLCTIVGASGKADWIVTVAGFPPATGRVGSVNSRWTLLYDPRPTLPGIPASQNTKRTQSPVTAAESAIPAVQIRQFRSRSWTRGVHWA